MMQSGSSSYNVGSTELGAFEPATRGILPANARAFAPSRTRGELLFRIRDVVFSFFFLLILSPFFALIALAIKLETAGPVLFRQRRGGLNGEGFTCLKFRTMTVCEDGDVVQQAKVDDPRITRVGRILRRTSLDELPQLVNVLRGDMSLVGPRPHALAHDRLFGARIPQYSARAAVKPGITGLAQISALRGECAELDDMVLRVRTDVEYVRRRSFFLDARIVFATVPCIIFGRNAR